MSRKHNQKLFICFIIILLAVFARPSMAALQDENLLAPVPANFKIGSTNQKGNFQLAEFVP